MKETTPTLATSSAVLPPEGAQSASGRPSGGFTAPTLATSSAALPPEGAQSASGRPSGGFLRTRIKICGLTREADVDAAVQAGADAIGFVLYSKSPRYVTPERAAMLARRLPSFVTPVLLFVNAEPALVRRACELLPNATLQFHGDETPPLCLALSKASSERPYPRPYLRAARIPLGHAAAQFDLVQFAQDYSTAQAILLDAHVDGYGGGGKTFNWSLLPPNVNAHLVLSGGLDSANVVEAIAALRSRGKSLAVDVSSGVEALDDAGTPQKGIKDPQRIRAFVAAVRAADAAYSESLGA